jgi:hypothetical protein
MEDHSGRYRAERRMLMRTVSLLVTSLRGRVALSLALAVATIALGTGMARANDFVQSNLVSDVSGLAVHTDAVLKNP